MKLHYYPETDSLYIDLLDEAAIESSEIAPDVVVDYNAAGAVVGIGVERASATIDLSTVEVRELPNVRVLAGPKPMDAMKVRA